MMFQIRPEMLIGARKQICLDIGLPFAEYNRNPNQKTYLTKTKYRSGTSYPLGEGSCAYQGADSFFTAYIMLGQLFLCVDEQIYEWAEKTLMTQTPEWFCSFANLRLIDEKLKQFDRELMDTHLYFLPTTEPAAELPSRLGAYELVSFTEEELLIFRENNRFGSAICFSETQPDVFAIAAMNPGRVKSLSQEDMAGMAGISRDGKYLWQIGINVDKENAARGLSYGLVKAVRDYALGQGVVPFYGTSESHIISQTVGLKAGFAPAFCKVMARKRG